MPRPQLGIGHYGNVNTTREGKTWVALARYRDIDGVTRRVKAHGTSKSGAAAALRDKLDQRSNRGQGPDIGSESRVAELAERYYAMKITEDLAPNTLYNLRLGLDNHVIPKLGELRIREATPQRIMAFVDGVSVTSGPGSGANARSALSGMFAAAARWGAVQTNPVTFTPRPKQEKKPVRALKLPELVAMREHAGKAFAPFTPAERLARAGGDTRRMGGKNRATVTLDIIDFMIGTGCRAAEPLGLYWEDVHLDGEVPWVRIHQQVVRVVGEGLRRTKTKEQDVRNLRLPGFVIAMLRRRREADPNGVVVFASERGGLLSPRQISSAWTAAFAGSEWDWVTAKTLRKTVATLVDAEHGSGAAAKQLGHASDKVTLRYYIAASDVPVDSGAALELFEAPRGTETCRLELAGDFVGEEV